MQRNYKRELTMVINVNASRNYDIEISRDLLYKIGDDIKAIKKACSVCIISDDTVYSLYGEVVFKSLKDAGFTPCVYTFEHGEKSKNLDTYIKIQEYLAQNNLKRDDLIVALGGGVVGDLAGFVASTYMRGIDFVQVPTTLLAMIDSSVGGKTAVDLPNGKNLVGSFYQPIKVIIDLKTLDTLPCAEYKNGMGEGIKYAMLMDNELESIVTNGVTCSSNVDKFVELCVRYKKYIVEEDEKESNLRRLLNLGHTFAHAIEKLSNYTIPHGVAVAQGLKIISDISKAQGKIAPVAYDKLIMLLDRYDMHIDKEYSMDKMLEVIKLDKKAEGEYINVVMPYAFGDCRIEKIKIEDLIR